MNLSYRQFNTDFCIHRVLYMNFMTITNQKSIINKNRERNPIITLKKVIKSQGKQIREEKNKELHNNKKTINKMALSA